VMAQLASLPVTSLRLDAETLLLLQRLGLKTVGALNEVPRLSLTRRFAKSELSRNPLMRLDQAMGRLAEPVSSVDARPPIVAQAKLPEPIFDPTAYLPELCRDLCGQLAHDGLGCRRLHLTVYRTDGEVSTLHVATSAPSRDPEHLLKLFRDRVEKINPGFGFDLITLMAHAVETIAIARERPQRLLSPPEQVRVLYAVPEGPPVQFMWRRQTHRVARFAGPERIAPEWWKDRPDTRLRDYFKVETGAGLRCWLYREGLHDDGRGGDPAWFVHGMFG